MTAPGGDPGAVSILVVDDDDVEREAIRRAFRKAGIPNPLFFARDGLEALDLLRGEGGRERLPRPYLILLDLNMPRMNGLEFLRELRRDPALRDSVVFVLTTSDRDQDKVAAFRQKVAGYILKPDVGEDFVGLMGLLRVYWRVVGSPPGTAGDGG